MAKLGMSLRSAVPARVSSSATSEPALSITRTGAATRRPPRVVRTKRVKPSEATPACAGR